MSLSLISEGRSVVVGVHSGLDLREARCWCGEEADSFTAEEINRPWPTGKGSDKEIFIDPFCPKHATREGI